MQEASFWIHNSQKIVGCSWGFAKHKELLKGSMAKERLEITIENHWRKRYVVLIFLNFLLMYDSEKS